MRVDLREQKWFEFDVLDLETGQPVKDHDDIFYADDEVLELTPRESALLQALMARPGHALTKERLFELVFPGEQAVQYEAVEVVVYRLRKKLAGTGATLMTLRGLGYLIKDA